MDQMILCAMAMMALRWWTSVAPWRSAVLVQRQGGVGRPRVK